MTREQWIAAFTRELSIAPPSAKEVDELLELAAVAAHASERTAAPLSCWIAGRAGVAAPEALSAAQRVAVRTVKSEEQVEGQ